MKKVTRAGLIFVSCLALGAASGCGEGSDDGDSKGGDGDGDGDAGDGDGDGDGTGGGDGDGTGGGDGDGTGGGDGDGTGGGDGDGTGGGDGDGDGTGGGDGDGDSPTAECTAYCDDWFNGDANCEGQDGLTYGTEGACLTACAPLSHAGNDGDPTGNTIQCRIYHLGAANADFHCGHAYATSTDNCVDP